MFVTFKFCVELSEDDVVISDGRVFLLQTALFPHPRTSADLTAFEQGVEECLSLFKSVRVSMLTSQLLSGGTYRSLLPLLPREFVTKPKEYLVAPHMGDCAPFPVNGWVFSHLKEIYSRSLPDHCELLEQRICCAGGVGGCQSCTFMAFMG